MAGYTDALYRGLCLAAGCDGGYTEMVSAKGLLFENVRTKALLERATGEDALAVQLFGSDPVAIGEAVRRLCGELGGGLSEINLNMGCPAPKITGNGDGSALMRDLPLAARVCAAAVRGSAVPVSVKFRSGWDGAHINAVAFAQAMEDSGAGMLIVHGRTRAQQYAGKCDLAVIAAVKVAVRVPVIGNGDVMDGESAGRMLRETNCDGLMIGRGALGRPFVFAEIRAALEGRSYSAPTARERIDLCIRHATLLYDKKRAHGLVEFRKHAPFYLLGMRGAAKQRVHLQAARDLQELTGILLDIADAQPL